MRTIHQKYNCILVINLCVILLISSLAVQAQEMKPPKPKDASTDLVIPGPLEVQEIQGNATLPGDLVLGFALDLNGELMMGNWDLKGKVATHGDRLISFNTDQGQAGNLAYRLPKGFNIEVKNGELLQ